MKKRKKSGFANFGILLAVLTILVLLAGAVYLTFYMSGKSISVLKNGFSGDIITIQEPDIYITVRKAPQATASSLWAIPGPPVWQPR